MTALLNTLRRVLLPSRPRHSAAGRTRPIDYPPQPITAARPAIVDHTPRHGAW